MDAFALAGYAALVVGSALTIFSRIPKQTITNYKELTESQDKRLAALETQRDLDRQQHIENVRAIAELQGQIKVYKELPLQEMATAMQSISEVNKVIAKSNESILLVLSKSALIAAEDRTVLTNAAEQVVEHQTVEHQVINKLETN